MKMILHFSLKHALILFMLATLTQSAMSETVISGKVGQVFDGNTFELITASEGNFRIVLRGIDCPELTQDYGLEAKQFLEKWLLHREVIVHIHAKDRQKNYIGVVLAEDNVDVRLTLLQHGLAWTSEKDPDPALESIRLEAAAARKGLWVQVDPTPPWVHRRQQSMLTPKSR